MNLTPKELSLIRDILIGAIRDCHDVLAIAAVRAKTETTSKPAAPATPRPAPLPSTKFLYSIRETAEALGLSRSTLYVMIERGELQPVRLGRRTLIRVEEIDALRTQGR